MMLRVVGLAAAALLVPAVLTAQTPNIPNEQASGVAKEKVAAALARRATRVRGEAVGLDNRPVTPVTPATPATGATRAVPNPDGGPATRAIPPMPAMPATPASPSRRPSDPGSQGAGRRP